MNKLKNKKGIALFATVTGIAVFLVLIVTASIWLFTDSKSDQEVTTELESKLTQLEETNVTYFFDMDWCKVLIYDGRKVSETIDSTSDEDCGTRMTREDNFSRFNEDDWAVFRKIQQILNDEYLNIVLKYQGESISHAEFHKRCSFCRTRYIYNPDYILPSDEEGELWHYPVNQNWYRVEQDWN